MKIFVFLHILLLSLLALPVFAQEGQTAMWNFNTGRNLEAQNRMNDANAYYDAAIRIATDDISRGSANQDSYVAITWSLLRQRRYALAISWGERGLTAYALEHRLVELMGEAYFYLGDHSTSLSFMQRYLHAVPRGGRASVAFFFIGEIYRFRGHMRHAELAYTVAVELEPNLELWWYRLAAAREAGGDFPEAIAAYEQVIRLNPAFRDAAASLARVRLRLDP